MKTLGIALALTLAPTLALAAGCNHSKSEQAMTCAAGTAYDKDAKACLPLSG